MSPRPGVALLAEGVGRNINLDEFGETYRMSPSSRRAWVEMVEPAAVLDNLPLSPSSRRAWVEMAKGISASGLNTRVALLAEGVGRNMNILNKVKRHSSVALLAEGVGRNRHPRR